MKNKTKRNETRTNNKTQKKTKQNKSHNKKLKTENGIFNWILPRFLSIFPQFFFIQHYSFIVFLISSPYPLRPFILFLFPFLLSLLSLLSYIKHRRFFYRTKRPLYNDLYYCFCFISICSSLFAKCFWFVYFFLLCLLMLLFFFFLFLIKLIPCYWFIEDEFWLCFCQKKNVNGLRW